MADRDNPWRSVDAAGHDWNSGEDFDPVPKAAATPAQAPQTERPVSTPSQAPDARSVQPPRTEDLSALAEQYGRGTRLSHVDTSAIGGYLKEARDAATQEAVGQIDRGVTQGVNELRRVQEDAGERYRTQQNQIDLDERRALDNRAAYDAARGVRGGIAGEQYSSIMNTAVQNRATLNNERTRLSTELSREMATLRANGEWEKSKALLQTTQQYLSQLAQLEQWAQEVNLNVDQFNAQLEQNYLNYLFQLRQMEISTDQWERSFAADRADTAWNQRFQREQADTARDQWQQSFAADRADTAWNQRFQREQADTARDQWQQSFDADRADTAWSQRFQREQADIAREQWERSFDADRADTAWNQRFQREQADTARADTERQRALSYAEAMMNVGMIPDAGTLKAAGLSEDYAKLYISTLKAAQNITGQNGSLNALAKAYVESGSETPKTWLAENYKSFGFASKPDLEEFQDAVDTLREDVEEEKGEDSKEPLNSLQEQWIRGMLEANSLTAEQKFKAVRARIEWLWPKLSEHQKKDLRLILSEYGLNYLSDEELQALQLQPYTKDSGNEG